MPLRAYSNGRKAVRDFLRFSVDGPRMVAAVRRVIRRERVDLVYVNGPRVLPAMVGVRCPMVFHAHSRVRAGYARRLVEWTLRTGNATVIAASRYIAENHLPVLGSRKVQVIYNGIGDFEGPARRFHRRPVRVGIVGRIAVEKGQMDFVRAARQIAETGGDVEFFVYGERLFAGAGYDAQVRALALNAPVTFCGWTNDVAEALQRMEILAVPSGPDEAATRVVMEAFSAGTPVVAYRSGGIPELVEHGRTGILTETPDFAALANSIRILIGDPGLMERLSAAGRKEWQQRFRVEPFRKGVCDLIQNWARSATSMRRG
jgi:glycosyltransferase involved in cell wall biosynthesis